MEGIGSEVSHKIRAAIKAKLIELGAYVDDELPDYIMVMVANKRTRAQMDEDLHLFLSSNTKIFTSWLHTVLQKLQEVTVATFENKKDNENKKLTKRKKSDEDETRSEKSSEEEIEKMKKHGKKHKETKKMKKNKYKHKEKIKSRKSEKEETKDTKDSKDSKERGKEDEKINEEEKEKKEKEKSKKVKLNEMVGKAILGDLKKNKKMKSEKEEENSSDSSSSSEDETNVEEKSRKEDENDINKKDTKNLSENNISNAKEKSSVKDMECNEKNEKNKKNVVEDEFNIEPLKPSEKEKEKEKEKENESQKSEEFISKKENESSLQVQVEKTISAPTEELLKEHNKIENERLKGEENFSQQKKFLSDSEESLSPEEIRKQLLLSRAKKKLEESKKAGRMRSNSPDVVILEDSMGYGGRQKDLISASSKQLDIRSIRSTHSEGKESSKQNSFRPSKRSSIHSDKSQSSERSSYRKESGNYRSKFNERKTFHENTKKTNEMKSGKTLSLKEREKEREKDQKNTNGEKKKNIIKISETLEKEKSLGGRREIDIKTKEKEENRSKKRILSSRVVTIAAPEAPEISSVIKVKPREFLSKDKQANKALILKAVAEAEKSIATLHPRPEVVPEPKKEAIYTKNLREKRYEKLAITLSNIRRSPNSRERCAPSRPLSLRLDRRISLDSEKSDKSRPKRDSSDVSEGVRAKSDLISKKISKSEDQFISSKTTIMEKNEKYIRCWLEGVEKAVKDDEMFNPNEMEDFVHSNPTDDENDMTEKDNEKIRKRKSTDPTANPSAKTLKLSEKEIANLRMIPDTGVSPEGPQIVVTLDGLDTKAIKDLILKNKESSGRPLLSSSGKKTEKTVSKEKSPAKTDSRKTGFEKMSDRFGRLNKVNEHEDTVTKSENKSCKRESGNMEKKKMATESKNRQLIAQLSEKFGKIDREFESRKRKRADEDRRYPYDSRREEKEDGDRNGRYRKSERRSFGFYRRS